MNRRALSPLSPAELMATKRGAASAGRCFRAAAAALTPCLLVALAAPQPPRTEVAGAFDGPATTSSSILNVVMSSPSPAKTPPAKPPPLQLSFTAWVNGSLHTTTTQKGDRKKPPVVGKHDDSQQWSVDDTSLAINQATWVRVPCPQRPGGPHHTTVRLICVCLIEYARREANCAASAVRTKA